MIEADVDNVTHVAVGAMRFSYQMADFELMYETEARTGFPPNSRPV